MARRLVLMFLIASFGALAGCAPAGVPWGATRHFELTGGGFYWTWQTPVEGGCVGWATVQTSVSVQISVASPCPPDPWRGNVDGKALFYASFSDHLVFHGYWPWTSEIYSRQFVYDEKGRLVRVLPCPNSLTPTQLSEMRLVVRRALLARGSNRERRVLARIAERLAATNGTALSSGQLGCTDEPLGEVRPRQQSPVDPWEAIDGERTWGLST